MDSKEGGPQRVRAKIRVDHEPGLTGKGTKRGEGHRFTLNSIPSVFSVRWERLVFAIPISRMGKERHPREMTLIRAPEPRGGSEGQPGEVRGRQEGRRASR